MIGRIYRITSPNTKMCYIGSTFLTLARRFNYHSSSKSTCNSKIILKANNASIELLEEIEVVDKDELRYYENLYIELYRDIAVNKLSAFGQKISHRERYKIYREKNLEKERERDRNRDRGKDSNRGKAAKEKITCVCGSIFRRDGKSTHEKSIKHQKYISSNK